MSKSAPSRIGQDDIQAEMPKKGRRAWFIGAGIVVAGVLIAAFEMFVVGTPAPTFVELMILVGVPAVYLSLMYVSLTKN